MAAPKGYYALYKGDDLLADGTIEEIAEQMGISQKTVYFYSSPSYKKRGKGFNRRVLIRVDDEDVEI